MELVRVLGAGSLANLHRIMDSAELAEWVALYRLEKEERLAAEAAARAERQVQNQRGRRNGRMR